MSQKTRLLIAGCIVSLVSGIYTGCIQAKIFTLSDEQLSLLDWDLKGDFWNKEMAEITAMRDVPGSGVEFDLYFPPGGNSTTYNVECLSSIGKGKSKLIGPRSKNYDTFSLKFTVLKINDTNIPDNWGPLRAGATIYNYDNPTIPNMISIGTLKNIQRSAVSNTEIQIMDIIEAIGFTTSFTMPLSDVNNSQGLKITLLVEPAPDTEFLSFGPPSLPQYITTGTKTLLVPDQYSKIQDAIDAAQQGDTINIKAGNYEESLSLKNGVSLKALEPNTVIITTNAVDGPVLSIQNCYSSVISDITLMHTTPAYMPGDFVGRFPVLSVTGSDVVISRCKIQKSAYAGVLINGTTATINECVISDNNSDGILSMNNSILSFSDNILCGNGSNGLHLKGVLSADVYRNTCIENTHNGISVEQKGAVNLLQNNCTNNKYNGIFFGLGVTGCVKDNICQSNVYQGIYVTSSGTKALIHENMFRDNKKNGIFFEDGAAGFVIGNKCTENLYNGISVADNFSSPVIHNNNCLKNKRCGLYLEGAYRVGHNSNEIEGNGDIGRGEIIELCRENKLDKLETIASRLREQKCRYANGNWQLANFYYALGEGGAGQKMFPKTKLQFEEWIKQQPNSITPRIALAKAYKEFAWGARGGGYAYEVSEKGWDEFKENLLNAEKVLIDAEDLNASDPELYTTWLEIGMGLHKTNEEMDALLEKGIAIEKNYWPLYISRGFALAPIWYGKQGELEAFAKHAVEVTLQDEGQILYIKIAQLMIGKKNYEPPQFRQLGFSYTMLKQSYEDLFKRYSDINKNYSLNVSCFLACAYDDKEEAKNLLVQIGSDWNKSVWISEDIFNKYKNWALTKTEKPPEPNE